MTEVLWGSHVPERWETKPLFAVLAETQDKNKSGEVQDVLSLSYGRIIDRNIEEGGGLLPASFDTYQIVEPEDIILRLTDLQNDQRSLRVGISPRRGIITSAYVNLRTNKSVSFPRYLFYALHAFDLNKGFYSAGGGVRQGLGYKELRRLEIPSPPLPEQHAIVAFLDAKLAQIDKFIANKRRLIELLLEQKQVIVNRYVTRGLDDSVELKDSGLDWLGQVPKHWEIRSLSSISSLIQTGPFGTQLHQSDYMEDGVPIINPSHIDNGKIVPDWRISINAEKASELAAHILKPGDMIFARRGEMGRCAAIDRECAGYICGTGSMRVSLLRQVYAEYLSYQVRFGYASEYLELNSVGSTMNNLNPGILGKLPTLLPPLPEQRAIVARIEQETSAIARAVAQAEREIELIQEYRTTLISEAVTGKIDVREWGE